MRHISKRIVAVVLTMMMVLSLVSWASAADYADMPTNWAKEPMEAAVENGLLQGNNGLLSPGGNLKRAQMAAILVRAFGSNEHLANLEGYTDVPDGAWYVTSEELSHAVAMELFQGNGDKLTPDNNITREQAFAVLARALKLADGDAADLAKFSDASQVSSWAVPEVAAMVKAGYVNGSNGKLDPKSNITRAQFAQVMYNIFSDYVKEEGTVTAIGDKSVVIAADDVTLKDVTVKGDLIIGEGVGEGNVYLDNVTVEGRLVVRDGGMNSIHIIGGSNVANVLVTKIYGPVRVVTEGEGTTVAVITVANAEDVIIEGAVETVKAEGTATVKLDNATVETVEITGKCEVVADNSEIGKVEVAAAESYLTLTNGSSADEVVVAETAKDAVVNVDAGTTIGKLETSADITVAGSGTVEEEVANGDVEIKKEAEVIERPEEDVGDTRTHVHDKGIGSYQQFDDKEHYYVCTVLKSGAACGEIIYEAHEWADSKWVATYKDGHTGSEVTTKPTVATAEQLADPAGDATALIVSFVVSEQKCSDCNQTKAVPYSTVTLGGSACDGNHVWVKGATVDATCAADGSITYTCSNAPAASPAEEGEGGGAAATCSATKVEVIPATGHRFDKKDAEASSAAKCYAAGADVYVCINPDCCTVGECAGSTAHGTGDGKHTPTPATKSVTLAATGKHTFTKALTSENSGTSHKIGCATEGCSAKKPVSAQDASEYTEPCTIKTRTVMIKDGAVVTEGTVGQDGVTEQLQAYCTVCGWDSGTTAHTHTYTAKYTANPDATGDDDAHFGYCICGEKATAASGSHTYANSKDSEHADYKSGKCDLCGTAHVHAANFVYTYTAGDGTNGAEATQHIPNCATCGYQWKAESHTYDKTAENPTGKCTKCEANHTCETYTYTANEGAENHKKICAVCGKVANASESCADTLEDDGKCDLCGKVLVTKADHDEDGSHGNYLKGAVTASTTAGKHNVQCVICKVNVEESCTYTNSKNSEHADYQSGKCDKCGVVHAHELAYTAANVTEDLSTDENTITKVTYKHTAACATCGYAAAAANCEVTSSENAKCKYCTNADVSTNPKTTTTPKSTS